MIVTLPLAIILFVCGVYCPPTEENAPARYKLQSCKSNSEILKLDWLDSTCEIAQSKRIPQKYCLVQTIEDLTQKCCFKAGNVGFISMKDAELTMLLYPYGDHDYTWNVTCVYSSIELARKFYKDMIQARMSVVTAENSELIPFLWVRYLKESDDTVLVSRPGIHLYCFERYVTVVVTNAASEVVFIFPADAIYRTTLSGDTEISVYIALNFEEPVLYKFGCSHETDASALSELLNRLPRGTGDSSAEITPRPFQNRMVDVLIKRLERAREQRIFRRR